MYNKQQQLGRSTQGMRLITKGYIFALPERVVEHTTQIVQHVLFMCAWIHGVIKFVFLGYTPLYQDVLYTLEA